ncbi:MAG: nitronate monooxygenase [Proteobacteria bacterium]|nr:nitronate monooxygenase [Pseudomonadota bacterium]
MFAMRDFHELVMGSIEAGVDMIITGAGFSRDIFKIGRQYNVPIVSIVSSPPFAVLAEKLGAAAIVVEAKEAGGHLGTDLPLRTIFPEIRKVVSKVPLIAAGGISDGYEMAEIMDKYGADGVQIATRFVMTKECDVSEEFKQAFVRAKADDVTVMRSPVGMPGRAIKNAFIKNLQAGDASLRPEKCEHKCLRKCDFVYCINDRLTRASGLGDVEQGLIFAGEKVYKFNEIVTVKQVFDQFVAEAESVYKESVPSA